MNIFLISLIVAGVIAIFELGKELFRWFFNKKNNEYFQAGFNEAVTHIYNKVAKTGKIDLTLNGNKLTLIKEKQ